MYAVYDKLDRIYRILKVISENPKITTNKIIENVRGVRMTVIQYLELLEKAGFIARLEDNETPLPYYYKRPKRHILTPRGEKLLELLEQILPLIEDLT